MILLYKEPLVQENNHYYVSKEKKLCYYLFIPSADNHESNCRKNIINHCVAKKVNNVEAEPAMLGLFSRNFSDFRKAAFSIE